MIEKSLLKEWFLKIALQSLAGISHSFFCAAVDVADPSLLAGQKVLEADLGLDLEASPSSRFGHERRDPMLTLPVSQALAQGHDPMRELSSEAAGTSMQHADPSHNLRPESAPARTVSSILLDFCAIAFAIIEQFILLTNAQSAFPMTMRALTQAKRAHSELIAGHADSAAG